MSIFLLYILNLKHLQPSVTSDIVDPDFLKQAVCTKIKSWEKNKKMSWKKNVRILLAQSEI